MRFKPLPAPPDSLAFVADAQRAVPLVPGSETDCCARLQRRLDLRSKDVARTWLTFLRALELAEETPSGFVRTDRDPTAATVRAGLRDRVFGATEVLAVLRGADGPLAADAVFEAVRETVPEWERHKRPNAWAADWRERVADLLSWFVLVDLAESTPDGYVAADRAKED